MPNRDVKPVNKFTDAFGLNIQTKILIIRTKIESAGTMRFSRRS